MTRGPSQSGASRPASRALAARVAAALLAVAAPAAADRYAIVTADGRTAAGDSIEWGDPIRLGGGVGKPIARGDLAALLDRFGAMRPTGPVLRLHDGQSFPGRLEAAAGELVRWRHAWLGVVEVPIDRIRSVSFIGTSEAPPPARRGDRIELANGDAVEGLVLSLGGECEMEPLDGGPPRSIPIGLLRSISFLERREPSGEVRVWCGDGTVVDGAAWGVSEAGLRLDGTLRGEATVPLEWVVAAAWPPRRLHPLAEAPVEVLPGEGTELRGWLPPPQVASGEHPLAAAPIEISGPVRVRWRLEPGSIVVADAILPVPMRRFGDFELIARDGGRELFRVPFGGSIHARRLRMEAASGELELEMTLGRHGPVGDLLRLERAVVIRPGGAKSP